MSKIRKYAGDLLGEIIFLVLAWSVCVGILDIFYRIGSRPRSFIGAGRGGPSMRSNTLPWNGWTGSTIVGCLNQSANIPPAEAEAQYYAAIEKTKMAA